MKFFSLLLSFMLAFSLVTTTAMAEDDFDSGDDIEMNSDDLEADGAIAKEPQTPKPKKVVKKKAKKVTKKKAKKQAKKKAKKDMKKAKKVAKKKAKRKRVMKKKKAKKKQEVETL